MYDGRTPLKKGTVVGHEMMGVIDEAGEAVVSIKKGDRVVLPFNIACGYCFNCHRGNTLACLTMNPEGASEAYVVDYVPERLEKAEELGATPGKRSSKASIAPLTLSDTGPAMISTPTKKSPLRCWKT